MLPIAPSPPGMMGSRAASCPAAYAISRARQGTAVPVAGKETVRQARSQVQYSSIHRKLMPQPLGPRDTFVSTSPPISRLSGPPGIRAAISCTVQGRWRRRATAIPAATVVTRAASVMAAAALRSGTFFAAGASWAPIRPRSRSVTRYSRPATASIHKTSSWLTPRLARIFRTTTPENR
jgi:hypothetical protein